MCGKRLFDLHGKGTETDDLPEKQICFEKGIDFNGGSVV